MKAEQYSLFVDESGGSSLNHGGKYFVLSTVLIRKADFEIIEGYLRLLKRKYLNDDLKNIHTTDLFERPYQKYRILCLPRRNLTKFIKELRGILSTIPYEVGIYYVDKDRVRNKLGYTPARGKKVATINTDLPYEMCSLEAISDFTKFLTRKRAMGEIIIESRLNYDSYFVNYFDRARRDRNAGVYNPTGKEARLRINSLLIANKHIVNGGLEIADVCAYACYRRLNGNPHTALKVNIQHLQSLCNTIMANVYVRGVRGSRLKEMRI